MLFKCSLEIIKPFILFIMLFISNKRKHLYYGRLLTKNLIQI